MAQKYFGSPARKMKADQASQIFGLDAEGKSSYGVPLSNYMNAQVWPLFLRVKLGRDYMTIGTTKRTKTAGSYHLYIFLAKERKRATRKRQTVIFTHWKLCAQLTWTLCHDTVVIGLGTLGMTDYIQRNASPPCQALRSWLHLPPQQG
jgi:hypothetical protein